MFEHALTLAFYIQISGITCSASTDAAVSSPIHTKTLMNNQISANSLTKYIPNEEC
jgi:hypothetical protein